jgi:hypothetical protein
MTIDGFSSLLMTRSVRVLFEINLKTYTIFGPVWPGGSHALPTELAGQMLHFRINSDIISVTTIWHKYS